ncbi:hypothetical protein C5167_013742 [Papaver somniferum]|uniref:Uncharacterized protein n=1 Tax=Papaver somniferum TaxID=3469 RepID=A0A4Y7J4M9_PAPSO|nr:hypothetical protein C5167_013742 [Papaver somniferum]
MIFCLLLINVFFFSFLNWIFGLIYIHFPIQVILLVINATSGVGAPYFDENILTFSSASLVRRSPNPGKRSASPRRTLPSRGESSDRRSHESPRKKS